jgi:hypothetical protein
MPEVSRSRQDRSGREHGARFPRLHALPSLPSGERVLNGLVIDNPDFWAVMPKMSLGIKNWDSLYHNSIAGGKGIIVPADHK